QIGQVMLQMPKQAYIGIALTSNACQPTTAVIDQIQIEDKIPTVTDYGRPITDGNLTGLTTTLQNLINQISNRPVTDGNLTGLTTTLQNLINQISNRPVTDGNLTGLTTTLQNL